MMLYLLITQLGWLAFTALLIVVVALYSRISQQVKQLRRDVLKLQIALEQQKTRDTTSAHADLADKKIETMALLQTITLITLFLINKTYP